MRPPGETNESEGRYAHSVRSGPELVGYWRLGERDGEAAREATGRHDGVYRGVGLGATGALIGDPDGAAEFDGATSRVEIPASAELSFAGQAPFSLEAWVRLSRLPRENVRILSCRAEVEHGVDGYELVVTPRGAITFNRYRGGEVDHLVTVPVLVAGEWAFVVAVHDGSAMRVYVSGALAGEREAHVELADGTRALDLGRRTGTSGSSTLAGVLDEVAVWARALPDGEVLERIRVSGRVPFGESDRESLAATLQETWGRTVTELLAGPKEHDWTQLLLPLYGAFELDVPGWKVSFAEQAGLVSSAHPPLGAAYLWGRFIATASLQEATELVPEGLACVLAEDLLAAPMQADTWPRVSDDVLLKMGLASDLLGAATGIGPDQAAGLREIRARAVDALARAVRWNELGGWLLAPDGIAGQTPQTAVLPVVLEGMQATSPDGSPAWAFFRNLRLGLERQFVAAVLVPPDEDLPVYRTTSLVDGRDGVDATGGEGAESSRTLMLGLWSRLPGDRIREAYRSISACSPLSEDVAEALGVTLAVERRLCELLTTLAVLLEPLGVQPSPIRAGGRGATGGDRRPTSGNLQSSRTSRADR
jgi:hypothetical protein